MPPRGAIREVNNSASCNVWLKKLQISKGGKCFFRRMIISWLPGHMNLVHVRYFVPDELNNKMNVAKKKKGDNRISNCYEKEKTGRNIVCLFKCEAKLVVI